MEKVTEDINIRIGCLMRQSMGLTASSLSKEPSLYVLGTNIITEKTIERNEPNGRHTERDNSNT